MLALIDSQLGAVDPASRQSAAAEIVAALIAAAKAGEVKAIVHLLDRKHGKARTAEEQERYQARLITERDEAEEKRRRAERNEETVQAILSAYPEVDPELAARFVRASVALMAPRNLTDVLRERLGLWQPVPPDESTLGALWREHGLPELAERAVPPVPPRCSLVELPTPSGGPAEPDPVTPPTPASGPTPTGARPAPIMTPDEEARCNAERDRAERERQERERRVVWFGDLAIDPFSQGM